MEGFEADDLIATLAQKALKEGKKVTIISCDKDLMQLIEEHVSFFDPMKNKDFQRKDVIEKFGVPPEKVIEVQALAGDASDNVPGVPGIGLKTAAELIEKYGTVENLLDHAAEIKQPKRREVLLSEKEKALISKQLVTLKKDVPLEWRLSDLNFKHPDADKLNRFLEEQEFRSLIPRAKRLMEKTPIIKDGETLLEKTEEKREDVKKEIHPLQKKKGTYTLIQTVDVLQDWIDHARKKKVVAIDTETTSLDTHHADWVGFSLSFEKWEAAYIPLQHRSLRQEDLLGDGEKKENNIQQINMNDALKILKPLLTDPHVLKVGQNIKYDLHILSRYGLEVFPITDTMVISYVLDGASHRHNLDELAERYLAHKCISYTDVCGTGKKAITFDLVPLDQATDYAAEDADVTFHIYEILKDRLEEEKMEAFYQKIEQPLISVLKDMETIGVKVDALDLRKLSQDFEKEMKDLEKEIYQEAGEEFNIGSPQQLGSILFEKMSLEGGKKSSKSGYYGTDVSVLEDLAAKGHKLPEKVLQWRGLSKLKSNLYGCFNIFDGPSNPSRSYKLYAGCDKHGSTFFTRSKSAKYPRSGVKMGARFENALFQKKALTYWLLIIRKSN